MLLWLFIAIGDTGAIPLLLALGFFIFAPVPVLLAWVQDTDSDHPSFMNGIYMTLMFGVSSILTMVMGTSIDAFGYEWTYRLAVFLGLGGIPFVYFIQLTE
jgi:FSR family fosmidomycin resistance protein-like MFS transporter